MTEILEGIFKGLLEWIYSLILEIVEFTANGLLDVFSMDLHYFESAVPVANDILNIILASGWALLLGNLVFQASKSMMTGLGFEGEDPKTLFTRTFVFGFFLLASRQICEVGLGISHTVITMLQVPDSVSVSLPEVDMFSIGSSWLLVIIIGFVLMWQIVKLFFEIGERYFLVAFLTLISPWAFAMGGSKSTTDIFKGWARMFASMCLMMALNVVFLKILLSAMDNIPDGAGVLPWMIFVVAIARVGRKIDSIVARIGLNPALTGDGLGRGGLPGMLSFAVMRSIGAGIGKAVSTSGRSAGGASGKSKTPPGGASNPPGNSGGRNGAAGRGASAKRGANHNVNYSTAGNTSNTNSKTDSNNTRHFQTTTSAETPPISGASQSDSASVGTAGTTTPKGANSPISSASHGAAGNKSNTTQNQSSYNAATGGRNTATQKQNNNTALQASGVGAGVARRSSVARPGNARASALKPGEAGKNHTLLNNSTRAQRGGMDANTQNRVKVGEDNTSLRADMHNERHRVAPASPLPDNFAVLRSSSNASNPGSAGKRESRKSSVPTDKAQETAGTAPINAATLPRSSDTGAAGTNSRRTNITNEKPSVPAGSAPVTTVNTVNSTSSGAAGTGSRKTPVGEKLSESAGINTSIHTFQLSPASRGAAVTNNRRTQNNRENSFVQAPLQTAKSLNASSITQHPPSNATSKARQENGNYSTTLPSTADRSGAAGTARKSSVASEKKQDAVQNRLNAGRQLVIKPGQAVKPQQRNKYDRKSKGDHT